MKTYIRYLGLAILAAGLLLLLSFVPGIRPHGAHPPSVLVKGKVGLGGRDLLSMGDPNCIAAGVTHKRSSCRSGCGNFKDDSLDGTQFIGMRFEHILPYKIYKSTGLSGGQMGILDGENKPIWTGRYIYQVDMKDKRRPDMYKKRIYLVALYGRRQQAGHLAFITYSSIDENYYAAKGVIIR